MGSRREPRTIGVLPLGRSTFDVAFAEDKHREMQAALEKTGHRIAGRCELLLDATAARVAMTELKAAQVDNILVLQVTFTDAAMITEIGRAFAQPLSIWALPEPRTGGRLRLNSFCGLNLAGHAQGLAGREYSYLYAAPDAPGILEAVGDLLEGRRKAVPVGTMAATSGHMPGRAAAASIRGAKIGRIGVHPDGFDTCRYERRALAALAGISVDELALSSLFEPACADGPEKSAALRVAIGQTLIGLDEVDQGQLDRSLRLKAALDALKAEGRYDAFAIRCWPETFTEYGGAICGPVAMMGEAGTPCACEADVYGALTCLLLQRVASEPVFLTDLVDLDAEDDTGVVWHCGQAPLSMADPDFPPRATVHSNRRMPLLYEFPLKPGRVTFFRVSQARGVTKAVIGGGEVLKRPPAFTGTSGVVRFDSGAQEVLDRIMGAALEHHLALAYGDHRDALHGAAAELGLPVLTL